MEKLPLNQFTRMSIDDAGGKRKGVLCPENLVKKIAMVICAFALFFVISLISTGAIATTLTTKVASEEKERQQTFVRITRMNQDMYGTRTLLQHQCPVNPQAPVLTRRPQY
jgi:hypothetical protein